MPSVGSKLPAWRFDSGASVARASSFGGVLVRLPVHDAFNMAFIGVLVRGADGDNSLGPGHLQLEVGVVGDRHELVVPWSSDDGMIGALKTHHHESEGLLPEVGRHAKIDQQVDLTYRQCLLPWYDAVEAARARLELCSLDAQEIESLEVDDVEAVAAIH